MHCSFGYVWWLLRLKIYNPHYTLNLLPLTPSEAFWVCECPLKVVLLDASLFFSFGAVVSFHAVETSQRDVPGSSLVIVKY